MSTIQDHRIQITIPSDKEKDGIRINPFELGSLIRDLTPGTVCEVATPRKYIAQLQSLLAILEEAANNQSVPDTYTDGFCAPSSFYVESEEKVKNEELAKLAKEWNSTPIADFNMDGFYPSYLDQPVKILFVGREACYMAGKNYIMTVYDSLINPKFQLKTRGRNVVPASRFQGFPEVSDV